jgi:hypothetical protein
MTGGFFAGRAQRQAQEAQERIAIRQMYAGCPHRHWFEKRKGRQMVVVERPATVPRVPLDRTARIGYLAKQDAPRP